MADKTTKTVVYITDENKQRLKLAAFKSNISMSKIISKGIASQLEKIEGSYE